MATIPDDARLVEKTTPTLGSDDHQAVTIVQSNSQAFNTHTIIQAKKRNRKTTKDDIEQSSTIRVIYPPEMKELLIDTGEVCEKAIMTATDDKEASSDPSGATEIEVLPSLDAYKSRHVIVTPNEPHPSLEFPPLYFLIKQWPWLLQSIKYLYLFRWRASYPLQQRVIGSRYLRKIGIYSTWGELLLVMPFVAFVAICMVWSFVYPSVSVTGKVARLPLIFAFATAMHSSYLTLLLGMPFERALWYHKLAGRVTFVNGIFHTYVAFLYPQGGSTHRAKLDIDESLQFAVTNQCNVSGTLILLFVTGMLLTSIPNVRRRVFEVFYNSHLALAAGMTACAFYHSGKLVPILVALTWGVDLFIRKLIMATTRYPRKARTRIISNTVIELRFPKTKGFDYNPGQFVFIAVPELGLLDWHPFSLSSSPGQKIVTLHIRKVGGWTKALYDLAQTKEEISILLEGPFGNFGVDLMNNRYSMVMLVSGGVGITPMQSICNQLIHEHSTSKRTLRKLSFIWSERDPVLMSDVDVVRRSSDVHRLSSRELERGEAFVSMTDEVVQIDLASTILSLAKPKIGLTQGGGDDLVTEDGRNEIGSISHISSLLLDEVQLDEMSCISDDDDERNNKGKRSLDDDTFLHTAYNNPTASLTNSINHILDIQVYLTDKNAHSGLGDLPFVFEGRPNLKIKFLRLREEALAAGENRIAVCVCAPATIVRICQDACVEFSDKRVQFDLHADTFT